MSELNNIISTTDDDYLIGLTNKGTLKRAYKDLEEAEISAEYGDSKIEVSVADQKCSIVSPLGESKCTCPSRSICRHIITAILWLKNNLSESNTEEVKKAPEQEVSTINKELIAELSEYPLKLIKSAMKKQYLAKFLKNAQNGKFPQLEEASMITGILNDEGIMVKLISPLQYSACSCHSKELCKHKAAVILAWQIKNKIVSLDELADSKDKNAFDVPTVHKTAKEFEKFLYDIFSNGLVRVSDDIHEHAEAMAVMCHSAKMADSERLMREISNRLKGYVIRSPEFDVQILFRQLMEALISVRKILNSNSESTLAKYMGEFKQAYSDSETLELIPLTVRNISSVSGYAGEIYYFLNKNTDSENKYLTYSSVRPTFYESKRNRVQYSAPWGLKGNLKQAMSCELRLKNPKLSGNKISSSSDTHAETLGKVNLNQKLVIDSVYRDFRQMIDEVLVGKMTSKENLVMVTFEKCIDSFTDEISQTHSIIIEDYLGQRLTIKARYRNAGKEFFKILVKVGEIMKNDTENQYTILANAYISNGECILYPIAIYDEIHFSKINDSSESRNIDAKSNFGSYEFFSQLFGEILQSLCDIIQSGINSYDLYDCIYDFSKECERSGLNTLCSEILELYNMLKNKNHTYNTDNTKIILKLAEIYNYISVGIEKTALKQAIYNLTKENEDEFT